MRQAVEEATVRLPMDQLVGALNEHVSVGVSRRLGIRQAAATGWQSTQQRAGCLALSVLSARALVLGGHLTCSSHCHRAAGTLPNKHTTDPCRSGRESPLDHD